MAYITAADFRSGTLKDWTLDLGLTTTEASDPNLTAAIARLSRRVDAYTGDHFEAEAAVTLTLSPAEAARVLYLPRRTRAVTTVKTVDQDGTETAQLSTSFRLLSSLNAAGDDFSLEGIEFDRLDVIKGQLLEGNLGCKWPGGPRTVKVTGNFSWATTPGDIKRAVAVMVYDHVKPLNDNLRRAERWATGRERENLYSRALSQPTGMPVVDEILAEYKRRPMPKMA